MNLKSRNKINPNFSMSSMTDIVFLLLIFFLLTSSLVPTNVLNLKLPQANGETVQQEQVMVSINNNGEYFIGNDPVAKENLETELNSIFANNDDPNFILQAEENTLTKDLVYVMDIANRNHYKMVLATEPHE